MHVTLHLTNNCNMKCGYCSADKRDIGSMSAETAMKGIMLAAKNTPLYDNVGVVFFGGEPLLYKDIIKSVIYNVNETMLKNHKFSFNITTNGLLLDDEFIDFITKNNVFTAVSIDGIAVAHNLYRVDKGMLTTHERVVRNATKLLKRKPYTPAMMVLNPDTVPFLSESVKFLFEFGFRYIFTSLNYGIDWQDNDLSELKKQYELLSKLYYKWTIEEEKFYLGLFEAKIASHIKVSTFQKERCDLGKKQISVIAD